MEPEVGLPHSSSKEKGDREGDVRLGRKQINCKVGQYQAGQSQIRKQGWLFGYMGHLWGGHMEPLHHRTVHQRQKGQVVHLLVPFSFLCLMGQNMPHRVLTGPHHSQVVIFNHSSTD